MRALKYACLAPALLLQGCFFFYIPGPLIDSASDGLTGAQGAHCVSSQAKVGDSIRLSDGSMWRVTSLSGTSYRCKEASLPIRAKLDPA